MKLACLGVWSAPDGGMRLGGYPLTQAELVGTIGVDLGYKAF